MKSDHNWKLIMQGGNRQWRKTTGLQGIKILPSKCLQEINIGKQNWEKQGRQWWGAEREQLSSIYSVSSPIDLVLFHPFNSKRQAYYP